jgi:putative oxidoreductase
MISSQITPRPQAGLFFPGLGGFYKDASPLTYAALRIAFGLVVLTHGLPKALGMPHGTMADPMAGATNMIANKLHLPFAPALAFSAMLLETIGALGVVTGTFTRFFAAALAIEMLTTCFAHAPVFVWFDRGFEYPMMLGFIALHISIKGSGRLAIDNLLPKTL